MRVFSFEISRVTKSLYFRALSTVHPPGISLNSSTIILGIGRIQDGDSFFCLCWVFHGCLEVAICVTMPRAPSENWTGSGCQTGEPEEVADGHDQIAVFWIAAGVGQLNALARIPDPATCR